MEPVQFAVTIKQSVDVLVAKEFLEEKTGLKFHYFASDEVPFLVSFASQQYFQELFKTQVRYTFIGFDKIGSVKQVWQSIKKITIPQHIEKYIENVEVC